MQHGFIKVAAITPQIRVADPYYNAEKICEKIAEAEEHGAKIMVFPELCLTGYTCQDLFYRIRCFLRQKTHSDRSSPQVMGSMH